MVRLMTSSFSHSPASKHIMRSRVTPMLLLLCSFSSVYRSALLCTVCQPQECSPGFNLAYSPVWSVSGFGFGKEAIAGWPLIREGRSASK